MEIHIKDKRRNQILEVCGIDVESKMSVKSFHFPMLNKPMPDLVDSINGRQPNDFIGYAQIVLFTTGPPDWGSHGFGIHPVVANKTLHTINDQTLNFNHIMEDDEVSGASENIILGHFKADQPGDSFIKDFKDSDYKDLSILPTKALDAVVLTAISKRVFIDPRREIALLDLIAPNNPLDMVPMEWSFEFVGHVFENIIVYQNQLIPFVDAPDEMLRRITTTHTGFLRGEQLKVLLGGVTGDTWEHMGGAATPKGAFQTTKTLAVAASDPSIRSQPPKGENDNISQKPKSEENTSSSIKSSKERSETNMDEKEFKKLIDGIVAGVTAKIPVYSKDISDITAKIDPVLELIKGITPEPAVLEEDLKATVYASAIKDYSQAINTIAEAGINPSCADMITMLSDENGLLAKQEVIASRITDFKNQSEVEIARIAEVKKDLIDDKKMSAEKQAAVLATAKIFIGVSPEEWIAKKKLIADVAEVKSSANPPNPHTRGAGVGTDDFLGDEGIADFSEFKGMDGVV
jgi:hypothetical protein